MNDGAMGIVVRGVGGVLGAATGITISLADVEQWLRIASLTAGLVVAGLTIRSLLKRNKQ